MVLHRCDRTRQCIGATEHGSHAAAAHREFVPRVDAATIGGLQNGLPGMVPSIGGQAAGTAAPSPVIEVNRRWWRHPPCSRARTAMVMVRSRHQGDRGWCPSLPPGPSVASCHHRIWPLTGVCRYSGLDAATEVNGDDRGRIVDGGGMTCSVACIRVPWCSRCATAVMPPGIPLDRIGDGQVPSFDRGYHQLPVDWHGDR